MKKKMIFVLFALFAFLSLTIQISPISSSTSRVLAASWDPVTPDIGDTVTITYDPAVGTLPDAASAISLLWGMYVEHSNDIVIPSPEMWPAGTTQPTITGLPMGRFIESPMTKIGDVWEVTFTVNEMADYFKILFTDGSDRDNNGGSYWIINTLMKTDRLQSLSPVFGAPAFLEQGSSLPLLVKAPDTATSWQVTLTRDLTNIDFTISGETYSDGKWTINANNDTDLAPGLYDLTVSATISAKTRTNLQDHAVSVIPTFKENFTFIHISDPQIFPDGSGAQSGRGNINDTFDLLDASDAEYIVCTGDITEWTDEISYRNFKNWAIDRVDKPMFLLPGNHDEFEGTGDTSTDTLFGGGQGTFEKIIGPMSHAWRYGNVSHVYIFSDDQNIEPSDLTWVAGEMAKSSFQNGVTRILMSHHPLDASYASETINNPGKSTMLSNIQEYKVTHYLHGHLHHGWYHLLDGVHHICAPQTYPFDDSMSTGGYIEYTVTEGNITKWTQYIDGTEVALTEPAEPTTPEETTTTTEEGGAPGFSLFVTLMVIPVIVALKQKKRN
ncbi:MAG: metallophosphoesterase family protein [Candidatus Hodarchaeales archaeon]|jgi:hypothetical protein